MTGRPVARALSNRSSPVVVRHDRQRGNRSRSGQNSRSLTAFNGTRDAHVRRHWAARVRIGGDLVAMRPPRPNRSSQAGRTAAGGHTRAYNSHRGNTRSAARTPATRIPTRSRLPTRRDSSSHSPRARWQAPPARPDTDPSSAALDRISLFKSSAKIDRMLDILGTALLLLISPDRSAATLKYTAPAGWTSKTPSSSMRVAEFVLPRADGDKDDASLVVYFFSATGGGSVQANVDRWISQMAQPDGRASKR